jgi:hypothetical protein
VLLEARDGAEALVPGQPADARAATLQAQLGQLDACLAGRAHSLPGLPVALRVQRIVEAILRGEPS